ncbi:MAG: TonB-dependent receptor [Chitinophagales bacterium]
MKFAIIPFFLILFINFTTNDLFAQSSSIQITGKVVESKTQKAVEFATVMVGNPETQKPITGTTTAVDGSFEVNTTATDFYIEVSFIGFVTKTVQDFQIVNGKVDLGTIVVSENSQALEEVVVRAEKSQTEFKLDKRVFNVGKDLSNTGASALEVLNNVPSVTVNIEGEISLRGNSGVQILINGKPSVLANEQGGALGTITAEMIEQIEVITNPSAKHDAEGTSGIINIVMKKEEKRGLNGSVTFNTGFPDNHSVGLSLNRRTEKFNLFSQLGVGYRALPSDNENINRDLVNNTTIETIGLEERNETFYNLILGTDYHINDYNVLTLSGNYALELEKQPSDTDFSFFDETGTLTSQWNRTEVTEATNPKWQYELQYKKDFKDNKDHTLLFSALGHFFGKDQSSEFNNATLFGTDIYNQQKTRADFKEETYTFKLDYTHPFSDKVTVETGAQYVTTDVGNDYAVSNLIDGEWVEDANLTNLFEYDQKVLGVYGTGAYEGDKWGIKVGLRAENTDLTTLLTNTNEENKQLFTNFFPSLHTSYKLSDHVSLQAGYSKRIRRPRLWDLNPFFNIRNNFSIRQGNPELQPEFTDSYELTSIFIFGQMSMNLGVYHLYTTDVIERVSTFENNVSTVKPYNVGTNQATGIEWNVKLGINKWLSLNGDFNFNYFNRIGTFEATNFDFNANKWTSRLTSKFKLPADIDFEVTANYNSSFQTFQGTVSDNLFADLGVRKKVFKGKAILNLSVRDVFASRIFETETLQPNFYIYNRNQRGRFVTFGVSYGFGKGEAMEFSGQKRH